MIKENIPIVRFKGFDGEWENRRLNSIFKYKQGVQVPIKDQFKDNKYKSYKRFIRIVDLTTNNEPKRYIDYHGDNLINNDDLFMIRYGQPGLIGYGYSGVIANNLFKLIPLEQTYNLFYKYILEDKYREIANLSTSTTMPAINFSSLNSVIIKKPNYDEQQSLGNLFSHLDNLITTNQTKLDLLKQYKKSLSQKMFPKTGEDKPVIRFDGFDDAWVSCRLGDISNIKTGSSNAQDAVEDGKYPFFIRSQTIKRSNKKLFDGEAILVPGEGNIGEIFHYINGPFDYHQRVYKISDFENSDAKFIKWTLENKFKKHALENTAKATVDSLRLPIVQSFKYQAPSLPEQTKLGNLFHNLDKLITHQEKKTSLLREYKKALLQKMFI